MTNFTGEVIGHISYDPVNKDLKITLKEPENKDITEQIEQEADTETKKLGDVHGTHHSGFRAGYIAGATAHSFTGVLKVRDKATGAVHQVWKYLHTGDHMDVWCNTWEGHHVIGQDCEWEK